MKFRSLMIAVVAAVLPTLAAPASADAAVKIAAKIVGREPKAVAAALQKVVDANVGGDPGNRAKQLLGQAKAACPEGFRLNVNADNFRALAFYRCEGFVQTGEGRNPLSGLPIFTLNWRPELDA